MQVLDELRELLGPALAGMETGQAIKVKRLLDRIEALTDHQEKKYNRAIIEQRAGQSL